MSDDAKERPIAESWLAFANEVFPESRSMTPDELREYNAVIERFFEPAAASPARTESGETNP